MPVHERVDRDRVPVAEAVQQFAVPGGHRGQHEVQPRGIAERGGRRQGQAEPAEHRLPVAAQPVLAVEIVDGDEPGPAVVAVQPPVVAAAALRNVGQPRPAQAPPTCERTDHVPPRQINGRAPHTS